MPKQAGLAESGIAHEQYEIVCITLPFKNNANYMFSVAADIQILVQSDLASEVFVV